MKSYKGETYQSLIDIERMIFVEEARKNMYTLMYKTFRLENDLDRIGEVAEIIKLHDNLVIALKDLKNHLLDEMAKYERQADDLEFQTFMMKFIYGKRNLEIANELHISEPTLYRLLEKIYKRLETTEYGKHIKEALIED